MQITPTNSIVFIGIISIITYCFVKRLSPEKGWFTYFYSGLLLVFINFIFLFFSNFFLTTVQNTFKSLVAGENYTARVINITIDETTYNSKGDSYIPTIRFTTIEGKTLEKKLEISTSEIQEGDKLSINYHKITDTVIIKEKFFTSKLLRSFLFFLVFIFFVIGQLLFAFNRDMTWYFNGVKGVVFYFLIPLIMIAFDALLVNGLFQGDNISALSILIIMFFIFVLSVSILGYFKVILSRGTPKIKQVGPNKWVGDWEDKEKDKLGA
ncbi:hypothetical protein [Cellulophaga baltica]|uniref:hypothetical protein n=1 Tax=Cellulophaga baltica TaxID=76594 RepID=UPI00249413AD|nr:hypothetical protein [Cellulophaga baltica]